MQGFGEHLQLSVFQCDLTAIDRIEMQAALQDIIDRNDAANQLSTEKNPWPN
jgi:CRISPR/Cas system-associated endoribonuclease Cas2